MKPEQCGIMARRSPSVTKALKYTMQQQDWLLRHCRCKPCRTTVRVRDVEIVCGQLHHVTHKHQHMQQKHPGL